MRGAGTGAIATRTTMIKPASRQIAVKVSPEGDRLITSGADYVRMSKKDLVKAAVEFYRSACPEEM
jgi:precorrin-6B methylase 2